MQEKLRVVTFHLDQIVFCHGGESVFVTFTARLYVGFIDLFKVKVLCVYHMVKEEW